MAWQIGKLVSENLSKNSESNYGKHLFERLEKDVGIAKQVLYKMNSFYKTYKKLPKDDDRLNWSHYRVLAGIKKQEERKYLQELTLQNGWDSDQLQLEVSKSKDGVKPVKSTVRPTKPQKTKPKKIIPARGNCLITKSPHCQNRVIIFSIVVLEFFKKSNKKFPKICALKMQL